MTTPHDTAVLAADEAYQNVQASEGIEHLTSEQQHMRGVAAAISAYLSSIGGIVCAREPVGYVTEIEKTKLAMGAGCVDLFGSVVPTGFPVVPLHAPIPEAGNGDGWLLIETADKDADRLMLGIVRNDVLEEIHIGGYRYAINEDEVSCWWSDQCDDEITPTHWRPLPPPPSIRSSDTGRAE